MQCALCNQEIIGTKYKSKKRKRYHIECFDKLIDNAETKNHMKASGIKNNEKNELIKYICQLYNLSEIPYAIDKQIDNFVAQLGYTYTGIQKTLYYFYELSRNNVDNHTSTIGIVPYYYEEAKKFFNTVHDSNELNKEFVLDEKTVHVKIRPKDRRIPYIIDINGSQNEVR